MKNLSDGEVGVGLMGSVLGQEILSPHPSLLTPAIFTSGIELSHRSVESLDLSRVHLDSDMRELPGGGVLDKQRNITAKLNEAHRTIIELIGSVSYCVFHRCALHRRKPDIFVDSRARDAAVQELKAQRESFQQTIKVVWLRSLL